MVQFERDGHVTIRSLVEPAAIESLQQAAKQIITRGELEALRHRYEAPWHASMAPWLGIVTVP